MTTLYADTPVDMSTEYYDDLSGDDAIYGSAGDDTLLGFSGNDDVYGGQGDDIVSGNGGDDWLFGNRGWDTLYGGQGNDDLYGGQGSDDLYGGRGDDLLVGGSGDDFLYGGSGDDQLSGGSGQNAFLATWGMDVDVITDFVPGKDTILLDGRALDIYNEDDLAQHLFTDAYGNAVVAFNGHDAYILAGVSPGELDPSDFTWV